MKTSASKKSQQKEHFAEDNRNIYLVVCNLEGEKMAKYLIFRNFQRYNKHCENIFILSHVFLFSLHFKHFAKQK